ncbi:MAG: hypothetical protein R3F31_22120 [Verrucomicrobiales bacterium]
MPDPDFALRRVEARVRLGGHAIPPETIRRRFARGLENLRFGYIGIVDEWSIYDGSWTRRSYRKWRQPPARQTHGRLHRIPHHERRTAPGEAPWAIPDFIGAEAALRRASAKAVAHARAAGLEPVVRQLVAENRNPDARQNPKVGLRRPASVFRKIRGGTPLPLFASPEGAKYFSPGQCPGSSPDHESQP